jgi:hypothetical protein
MQSALTVRFQASAVAWKRARQMALSGGFDKVSKQMKNHGRR